MNQALATRFLRDVRPEGGTLADLVALFREDSIRDGADITNERRTAPDPQLKQELRDTRFYVANVSAAERNPDGTVYHYLTDKVGFNEIYVPSIKDVCEQLLDPETGGFYHFTPNQKETLYRLVESGHAVKAKASKLGLRGNNTKFRTKFRSVGIPTDKVSSLAESVRRFAEMGYGMGSDLRKNIEMLRTSPPEISVAEMYFVDPNSVIEHSEVGEVVGGACWLWSFGGRSCFVAGIKNVDHPDFGLRGYL
jgi:hypothetical protein